MMAHGNCVEGNPCRARGAAAARGQGRRGAGDPPARGRRLRADHPHAAANLRRTVPCSPSRTRDCSRNCRPWREPRPTAAETALVDLRRAQDRLVQSEKMASLGQLTAGIAHEIKNPLNFVNNSPICLSIC